MANHISEIPLVRLTPRTLNIGQTRPEEMRMEDLLKAIKRDPKDDVLTHELLRRKLRIDRALKGEF